MTEITENERRKHVETAIADSRIEGYPPPSRPEQAILDAYIRGEIEAANLVTAYRERQSINRPGAVFNRPFPQFWGQARPIS